MLDTSARTVSIPVPFLAVTALLQFQPHLAANAFFQGLLSSRSPHRGPAWAVCSLSRRESRAPLLATTHTTTPAQPSQLTARNRSASPRSVAERLEIACPDVILAGSAPGRHAGSVCVVETSNRVKVSSVVTRCSHDRQRSSLLCIFRLLAALT
jgi:hypothetical protein